MIAPMTVPCCWVKCYPFIILLGFILEILFQRLKKVEKICHQTNHCVRSSYEICLWANKVDHIFFHVHMVESIIHCVTDVQFIYPSDSWPYLSGLIPSWLSRFVETISTPWTMESLFADSFLCNILEITLTCLELKCLHVAILWWVSRLNAFDIFLTLRWLIISS